MDPRVLVLTDDCSANWSGNLQASSPTAREQLAAALAALPDYDFEYLSPHDVLLERLLGDPPDMVLNLCDSGLDHTLAGDPHLPALLELLDIPFTGAGPAGLVLCGDKHVAERVADDLGVPVPHGFYLPPDADFPDIEAFYPALIKPARGDGGVGIFPQSVVRTSEQARSHLAWLRRNLPGIGVLWQEYLPGPEYVLTVIGNPGPGLEMLPPLEVDFAGLPGDLPEILPSAPVAGPGTEYSRVRFRPAQFPGRVVAEMQAWAERLFGRLQCRDYARFDFRSSEDGVIKLLDVNPNPTWSAAAKIAIMAQYAGVTYAQMLGKVLDAAWTPRAGASSPAA